MGKAMGAGTGERDYSPRAIEPSIFPILFPLAFTFRTRFHVGLSSSFHGSRRSLFSGSGIQVSGIGI